MEFKTLIYKDLTINGVKILNVPMKIANGQTPMITKGESEKIKDLIFKASALRVKEIDFSYRLGV